MEINILHLRASNFYGGAEKQLHYHSIKACSSGFNIIISSFTERGQSPEFLRIIAKDNISTYLFNVKNAYDPKAIQIIRSYIKEKNIHILCTHDYRTHLIGFLATRSSGTKWVAFSHGWTKENWKVRLYHRIDKIILRFADCVVAVSHSQKQKLKRVLIPGRKISVVHNAVEPDCFSKVEKVNLHLKFGFTANSIICVSAGRFSHEKGQIYLVKAAIKAIEKNDFLRFILFGDGPDLEKIKDRISGLGYQDKILCPGFEKNLLSFVKGADILINPSLSEGLPIIVLEAIALGIPIVATAVGGVPEVIQDGVNGYLVLPKDVCSLAEKILSLSSDRTRAKEFADKGLQTIMNSFTFTQQNLKLTQLYRQLLS
jgi:glycosyltransferase involved in cell wall biosynthesis